MSDTTISNNNIKARETDLETEPVSEDGRFVSEEEYWEKYYEHLDFNYEWNNGILEEKPVSDFKNVTMYYWFLKLLGYYLETTKAGKVVITDFGFRLALPEKITIRKPDLAVILTENPTDLSQDERSFRGIYDLCVELISDLTRKAIKRDTIDKKEEYEAIGVKEYYILDAANKHMAFYRRNLDGIFEPINLIEDDIVRSEVLEGFQFRASDLFRQPSQMELIKDQVYCNYVLPSYKELENKVEAEKQRAEAEKQRAEVERLRADTIQKELEEERRNAEKMAEKLRSLGIQID